MGGTTTRLFSIAWLAASLAACTGDIGGEPDQPAVGSASWAVSAADYELGFAAYQGHDWPTAVEHLTAVVGTFPDHEQARLMLGLAHYALGSYQAAYDHLRYVVDEIDPLECSGRFWTAISAGEIDRKDILVNQLHTFVDFCACHPRWTAAAKLLDGVYGGDQYISSGKCEDPEPWATFKSQSVPTTMVAGQTYSVSVEMINHGHHEWWDGLEFWRLGNVGDDVWGVARDYIDPGEYVVEEQSHAFQFEVTAPDTPGSYRFQWRMLVEGDDFFGDATPPVDIQVCADAACSETPDSKTVYPTDDTFVSQRKPNKSFGGGKRLQLKGDGGGKGRAAYLRFSVVGLDGPVKAAKLHLHNPTNQTFDVKVDKLKDYLWSEETLSWSNTEDEATKPLGAHQASAKSWFSVDVTAVVKKDGSYTFRLSREAAAGIRKLSSKESPNRPYLEIVTE